MEEKKKKNSGNHRYVRSKDRSRPGRRPSSRQARRSSPSPPRAWSLHTATDLRESSPNREQTRTTIPTTFPHRPHRGRTWRGRSARRRAASRRAPRGPRRPISLRGGTKGQLVRGRSKRPTGLREIGSGRLTSVHAGGVEGEGAGGGGRGGGGGEGAAGEEEREAGAAGEPHGRGRCRWPSASPPPRG